MAREFSRTDRIGEQLQRDIADILRTEMNDPRLNLVTISTISLSRDLAHATVLFTVMNGDADRRVQVTTILNGAAGFFRRLLGRRLRLRSIPQLHFRYDEVPERGSELSALIDRAVAADARPKKDEEHGD